MDTLAPGCPSNTGNTHTYTKFCYTVTCKCQEILHVVKRSLF